MRSGGGAEPASSEDALLYLSRNLFREMVVHTATDSSVLINVRTMLNN